MARFLTDDQLALIEARTRVEVVDQGLPEVVEDPATLAKVARLVSSTHEIDHADQAAS